MNKIINYTIRVLKISFLHMELRGEGLSSIFLIKIYPSKNILIFENIKKQKYIIF